MFKAMILYLIYSFNECLLDVRNCASLLKLTHLLKKNASFDKLAFLK